MKDAIARWPDVPAAYGWLSLDARGRWRFHPQGLSAQGGPGESITNPQILDFIYATTRMTTPTLVLPERAAARLPAAGRGALCAAPGRRGPGPADAHEPASHGGQRLVAG
ncbi:DUF2946 family protein [Achromobacter xylosoxidans]